MPTATPGTSVTITFHTPPPPPTGQRQSKLLNYLAEAMRSRHYSRRTKQAYLLEAGSDIRIIQKLSGHKDVSTSMIYAHVLNIGSRGVQSPAGDL